MKGTNHFISKMLRSWVNCPCIVNNMALGFKAISKSDLNMLIILEKLCVLIASSLLLPIFEDMF